MKKKKDEKKRRRNRSINFRLTPQDEIRIRERITVVGIPMQEFFLNAFTDMKIEIKWGMFESERLAIELKRLGSVLESIDILLAEKSVSLRVPLRLDELRELVGPESHQRRALSENIGHLADCVEKFLHINPLTVR